jgi:hypothetical protein
MRPSVRLVDSDKLTHSVRKTVEATRQRVPRGGVVLRQVRDLAEGCEGRCQYACR